MTDPDKSMTDFDKSVTDLDKSMTDFDKYVTDLDKSMTDFDKSVTDLDKSMTDFDKSVTDLDHFFDAVDGAGEQRLDLVVVVDVVGVSHAHEEDVGWEARDQAGRCLGFEVCHSAAFKRGD